MLSLVAVYIALSIGNHTCARAASYIPCSSGKTPGLPNRNAVIVNLQIRTLLYVLSLDIHYVELHVYLKSCTCVYTISLHIHKICVSMFCLAELKTTLFGKIKLEFLVGMLGHLAA